MKEFVISEAQFVKVFFRLTFILRLRDESYEYRCFDLSFGDYKAFSFYFSYSFYFSFLNFSSPYDSLPIRSPQILVLVHYSIFCKHSKSNSIFFTSACSSVPFAGKSKKIFSSLSSL